MYTCQYHRQTTSREKGTKSHRHVCPSPSVSAPVDHPSLLAVIAKKRTHTTPLYSIRIASQHATNACFTLRRAHFRARFPTEMGFFDFSLESPLSACAYSDTKSDLVSRSGLKKRVLVEETGALAKVGNTELIIDDVGTHKLT